MPFLVSYDDTRFFNIFIWHLDEDRWSFRQQYEQEHEMKLFARKEMVHLS